MATGLTITAANSILLLGIDGLYPVAQQLQGFGPDRIFGIDDVTPTETAMGVDGHMSIGFVFTTVTQNVTLQADSPSNEIFEQWYANQLKLREALVATGQIQLPSLKRKYAMMRGALTRYAPTAAGNRVMQARQYQITWERIEAAPL